MAILARIGYQRGRTNRSEWRDFFGDFEVGATGAVNSPVSPFFTITRTAAGTYLIQLIDKDGKALGGFTKFLRIDAKFCPNSGLPSTNSGWVVSFSEHDPAAGSFKIIFMKSVNVAGTETFTASDPIPSGANNKVLIRFSARMSSAPI